MIASDVILVRDGVYGSIPDASWEQHQTEQPLEQGDVITIEAAAKAAPAFAAGRERGALTVLTPAPAAILDPTLLPATDWLVPNEVEAGCWRLG